MVLAVVGPPTRSRQDQASGSSSPGLATLSRSTMALKATEVNDG
jgi:hypothetical protein